MHSIADVGDGHPLLLIIFPRFNDANAMTVDMIFIVAFLVVAIVLFASEQLPVDIVALMMMWILLISGIITPEEEFLGLQQYGDRYSEGDVHPHRRIVQKWCSSPHYTYSRRLPWQSRLIFSSNP